MATIICYDVHGQPVPVASEALTFRPAVYGIFIENNRIFLLTQPESGLWHPPGVVLADNETPSQALLQNFRQLIGIPLKLGPMLFVEDQYLIDAEQHAWKYSVIYYGLTRSTTTPLADPLPGDWILLDDLKRQEMQFGFEAVQAGRLQMKG